jgi:type IV pilus assembly protein PilW
VTSTARRTGSGFTLVEMMIALVLGMVIIGALLAIFMSSKRTYSTTEAMSRMQESARFGAQFAARELRMAGYSTSTQLGILNRDLLFPANGPFASGVVVVGTDNAAGAGLKTGADTIRIRYTGDANGSVHDCLGNEVAANTQVSAQLSLSINNELQCSDDGGATQTVLVDGISDFQLKYAVDTSGDRYADSTGGVAYVDAGSVSNWAKVSSVHLALQVAGVNKLQLNSRWIVSVVALRNQLP